MANNATYPKRRQPGRKAEDIRLAWKEQAPEAVFAGKNLADLEATIAALAQCNEDLKIKDQARSAALRTRGEKLAALKNQLRVIVKGVQGHPEFGEDSPLYRAMGFVPFSERGTGLTRKGRDAGDSGSAEEKTAA